MGLPLNQYTENSLYIFILAALVEQGRLPVYLNSAYRVVLWADLKVGLHCGAPSGPEICLHSRHYADVLFPQWYDLYPYLRTHW